jgi:phenylalanyl-tRNA synthetase beta chain
MPHVRPNPLELRNGLRDVLAGAGLTEVVTPALVPPSQAATLAWPALAAEGVADAKAVDGPAVTVTNPLSERHAVLRQGLVASLLDVLALNERHGRVDLAIFEIGKGYAKAPDGTAAEWWRLAFLLTGAHGQPAWNLPPRSWDLDDGKGIVELLARALDLVDPRWVPHTDGAPLHPGRAARGSVPGALAGIVGELHPSVLAAWDLRAERVIVGELALRGLSGGQRPPSRVAPLSHVPRAERDLALVVPEALPAGDLAATLRTAGGERLRGLSLFDIYRGAPLLSGEKSLAWRVSFGSDERPLSDEEIDAAVAVLVSAAAAAHGARLRA